MHYTIRHVTRFTYDAVISESVMEARMQPRSEDGQRCVHFGVRTSPAARVMMYRDHDGNIVHHFNIPSRHARLTVTAEALVECTPTLPLPDRLKDDAWGRLDLMAASGEHWEALAPSTYARPTPLLETFARDLGLDRRRDPLVTLRRLSSEISARLAYRPNSTRVDSPIDHALEAKAGVCQDFAHVMIALARMVGVPCRYVSGYLFHRSDGEDRSSDGATHAWVEALLPGLGWVGFDPTNDLIASDRHIRVAVGRDYADVPPTRGVYKGASGVKNELAVAVEVGSAQATVDDEALQFAPWMSRDAAAPRDGDRGDQQ